jgi:hypothetical protein
MKFLAVISLLAFACSAVIVNGSWKATDSPEEFIQGSWHAQGTDPSGRHGWFQEWTFEKGKFKHTGYPPLEQEGSYRILKTEGNKLTLELYDQKGTFGTENSQIEVVIDKDKGKLKIKGQGPFSRVKSESKPL